MPLYSYQEPHVEHLVSVLRQYPSVLDASDMGVGKTVMALEVAARLGVTPLILCPKTLVPGWESAMAMTGIFGEVVSYETARGRRKHRKDGTWDAGGTEWFTEHKFGKGSKLVFVEPPEMVIFDEVQVCASASSRNGKMLKAARRQCRWTLMLSATPADSPLEFGAIGYALDLHQGSDRRTVCSRSWEQFLRDHACFPQVFGGWGWTTNPERRHDTMARLRNQIFPVRGARLAKADIPGFPATQISVRYIPHDGPTEKLSEKLRDAYLDYEKRAENAPTRLEEVLRLRQAMEIRKIPHLVDLAVTAGSRSKVAVFVNFIESGRAFADMLQKAWPGVRLGYVIGDNDWSKEMGLGPTYRATCVEHFCRNELDALLLTTSAGGAGISLQDITGAKMSRTSIICPCHSSKQVRQITGRPQRLNGGFSEQWFIYTTAPVEKKAAKSLESKLNCLDTLTDVELYGGE